MKIEVSLNMKLKIIVGLSVVIVAVVLVSAFVFVRQPVSLSYEGILMQISSDYVGAELQFKTDGVLYNCEATVSYLAYNGSWVQLTKELGTVDVTGKGHSFTLTDCQAVPNLKLLMIYR
jgi:hypothetical protein